MHPEKPTTGSKLPNLYQILNLPAKETDEQSIKAAINEFSERIKQITSAEAAKQAARLLAIAKQNLLEPTRKAAYDSLWDKVYQSKSTPTSTSVGSAPITTKAAVAAQQTRSDLPNDSDQPQWDLEELQNLLPQGDPNAPLDLAAYLDSADSLSGMRSLEDLDRDFRRLLQLVDGQTTVSAPVASVASVLPASSANRQTNSISTPAMVTDSNTSHAYALASDVESNWPEASTSWNTAHSVTDAARAHPLVENRNTSMVSGSRKYRKSRDRSLLFMMSGGLTLLLGVLGLMVVLFSRQKNQQPNVTIAERPKSKASQEPGKQAMPSGRRSGLPQPGSGLPKPGESSTKDGLTMDELSGNKNETKLNSGTLAEPEQAMASSNSLPASPMTPADNTTPQTSSDPNNPVPPATDLAEMPEAPLSAAGGSTTPPTSVPSIGMESEEPVSLTDSEKAAWKKLLLSARQDLGARRFESARKSLQQAAGLTKSNQQKAQLQRLNTILPLAEQFHEAIQLATSEMQAGEVIKTETQEISFIEASEEKLIFKIKGRNERYTWDKLPIKLAHSLADLKLDQSPKSAAVKAAFTAVHSKINSIIKEEARKWMQAAAAANVVPPDTHEVFDDNYSLD